MHMSRNTRWPSRWVLHEALWKKNVVSELIEYSLIPSTTMLKVPLNMLLPKGVNLFIRWYIAWT